MTNSGDNHADARRRMLSFNYKVAGISLLLVIAAVIILSRGNEMITGPYIESQLQQIASDLSTQAAIRGDEASLTFTELNVEGSIFNKRAIISGLKLEYGVGLPFGSRERTVVTTASAIVTADQVAKTTLNVDFPEPFVVEKDGYAPITLTFDGTPRFRFRQRERDDSLHNEYSMNLPERATLAAEATKDAPAAQVSLSYQPDPVLTRTVTEGEGSETRVEFKDVHFASAQEEAAIHINNLALHSKETQVDENRKAFTSQFMVADLTYVAGQEKAGPYQFAAELGGEYVIPAQTEDEPPVPVNDIDIELKRLMLSSRDFSVNVAGTLHRKPDDPMPFGKTGVVIDHFDFLRGSKMLSPDNLPLVDAIIEAIAGMRAAEIKQLKFEVKRDKGGTYHIGNTTFEKLVGLVITHSITKGDVEIIPVPNSAAPPADPSVPRPDMDMGAPPPPAVPRPDDPHEGE